MRLTFLLFLTLPAFAQDATSLLNDEILMARPPATTTVLTLAASQGDGTILTLIKTVGSTINLSANFTNSLGSTKIPIKLDSTTSYTVMLIGFGDVSCMLVINPTSAAILLPASTAFPSVPSVSVAWNCSTQIRVGGVWTGQQTPAVSGTVVWP